MIFKDVNKKIKKNKRSFTRHAFCFIQIIQTVKNYIFRYQKIRFKGKKQKKSVFWCFDQRKRESTKKMSSLISTESSPNLSLLENGGGNSDKPTAEMSRRVRRTVPASSMIRKRSDLKLISRVRWEFLRRILTNLQHVLLGTKLFLLFPAVPLAVVAHRFDCPRVRFL